jgi:penicillin-binding protein 1A
VDDTEPDALDLMRTRRPRPRRTGRRVVAWLAGLAVVCALLIAGLAVGAVALFVHDPKKLVGDCDLSQAHARWLGENTVVYAGDGSRLGVVPSSIHRRPIPLARMGRWLPAATVAVEDRRFWSRHGALDYEAIVRAAVADVRAHHFKQGGSTLIQQLARDRYLRDDRPELDRKLKEACLAVQLSDKLPRRRILELYLNGAFYGAHAYGADAAARTYYSRPPAKLSLLQAATLAGLPQAPTPFNPLRHPRAAKHRRNEVLAALRAGGAITPARYARVARRPLHLEPTHTFGRIHEPPFFETARLDLVRRFGGRPAQRGRPLVRPPL